MTCLSASRISAPPVGIARHAGRPRTEATVGRVVTLHDRWLEWSSGRFDILLGLVVTNYVVLMILPNDELAVIVGAVIVSATVP